ncbi:class IV adenylate cyclase [Patescibacteria group bacterium]|nr:class IV adenylate cyclase [Patescibacteria group bacterium]MCL5114501.1 class IV adenylate cyclase [Patescibacteria group bacterium]
MREIEIKLRVKNFKALEVKLTADNCRLSDPIRQEDVIYSLRGSENEWREAKEGDIIVRIRRENNRSLFTLKKQQTNEMDNTELETEVSDPDALHEALLLMGYVPQVEVKKNRREGKWGEYEICLDEVDELGTFVELEKLTSEDADPNEVREELFKVLENLGLSRNDEETRGYDTQMYLLRKK